MIQNKHIIRLSFIGLFLNIIANIILYRYFMIETIIIHNVVRENAKIANFYKQHVWDNHNIAVSKFQNNSYKNLLQDQDFIKFAKESIEFFIDLNSQVSLFDVNGDKIITTNKNDISNIRFDNDKNISESLIKKIDAYFLKELVGSDGLKNAFKGVSSNNLVANVMLKGDDGDVKSTIVTSYIPIIDDKFSDFPIDSVLEINTDVTEQWNSIASLEEKVLLTFVIILLVFFIIILYNTNYAQRIINIQFEANRALEAAKVLAENENLSKSMFLANVTHELRTPLNAIIGFSEIILADKNPHADNKRYTEYIQDINNSGNHLLGIINDILDFSKACADRLKLDSIELDLNKLIISTMRFIAPRALEAKVQLIEQLPENHIIIKADPKRLKQVLLNLLSNAVKFTNENGSITAKVTNNALEKLVYIKIIDTGIGINEKDIPKALSVFGQIDSALSKKHDGTGLGLPLTQKLVELMGGDFDFKSIVDIGTVVTLTFRCHDIIGITN
jgi:two-component system cell cycle sensor histidine kinase PleC